jgi:uncharacterized protein YyaL (SSP411 family)
LAETIPGVPGIKGDAVMAVVCSGFSCRPPVSEPEALTRLLRETLSKSAA